MAKRSKEEALGTRERILDAAVQVFHARGVARPSLSDVAELAGVTRGAVYGHFRNKGDLFDALCERVSLPTEIVCEGQPLLASFGNDALGELRIVWLFVLHRTVGEWRLILDIIFHRCEIVEDSGMIQRRLLDSHNDAYAHISGLLTKAIQLGQLSSKLDVPLATTMMHATIAGLISNWLLSPQSFDLASELERCVDVMIDTLRSTRALERRD